MRKWQLGAQVSDANEHFHNVSSHTLAPRAATQREAGRRKNWPVSEALLNYRRAAHTHKTSIIWARGCTARVFPALINREEQLWGLFNPNFLYMRASPKLVAAGPHSKWLGAEEGSAVYFFTQQQSTQAPKSRRRRLFDFCQAWKIEKKSARTGRFCYMNFYRYLWPSQFLINRRGKSLAGEGVSERLKKIMENGAGVRNDSQGIHHLIRVVEKMY